MDKRVVYSSPDGGVVFLVPTGEIPIEEVARKDVPVGIPYKIVDAKDIPSDNVFRAAWEADMSSPDGVAIGADAWFAEQAEKKAAEEAAATKGEKA